MECNIQTFSPIHIGTGNTFEPFEFIIINRIFYKIDQDKAFKIILQKYPDSITKLDKWISDNSKLLAQSKDNLKQSEIRQKFNLAYFCENILGDKPLTNELINKASAYKCKVPYSLQSKYQISECIKDANYNPYIPGSSIKGAIRTALLNIAILESSEKEITKIINTLKTTLNNKLNSAKDLTKELPKISKFLDEKLAQMLCICGKKKFDRNTNRIETKFDDIKFDLFKFIKITDAIGENVNISILPPNLYVIDKNPQSQLPAIESIDSNSIFKFNIIINEDEIRLINRKTKDENYNDWIEFSTRFKKIFGVDIDNTPAGKLEEAVIDSILEKVTKFSKLIINHELKWFKQAEISKNTNIEDVKDFYLAFRSIPNMLKLGWASGFINVTVYLSMIKNGGYNFIKQLFESLNIGIPISKTEDNNAKFENPNQFPTSRRFVSESLTHPIDPLGWFVINKGDEVYDLEE